jgi:hypothetical protein
VRPLPCLPFAFLQLFGALLSVCDACRGTHDRRGSFCISDEQYIGTALSYFLATEGKVLDEEMMGTVAVAMATSGDGFAESDVTLELLDMLRAGTENTTFLQYMVNHYGDCAAHDRSASLSFTCSGCC